MATSVQRANARTDDQRTDAPQRQHRQEIVLYVGLVLVGVPSDHRHLSENRSLNLCSGGGRDAQFRAVLYRERVVALDQAVVLFLVCAQGVAAQHALHQGWLVVVRELVDLGDDGVGRALAERRAGLPRVALLHAALLLHRDGLRFLLDGIDENVQVSTRSK